MMETDAVQRSRRCRRMRHAAWCKICVHSLFSVSLLVCSACVSRRGECVITGLVSTILHLRRAGSCYYSITDIITAEELVAAAARLFRSCQYNYVCTKDARHQHFTSLLTLTHAARQQSSREMIYKWPRRPLVFHYTQHSHSARIYRVSNIRICIHTQ